MSITVTSGLGCGRRLLWSVFWTLVVAEGSTLDLQNNRTRSVEENWTSSTTELQPNLRTEAPTQGTSMTATGPSCDPVQPPRRGSFFVDRGTGASVGSVLTFWCREGYQLVGSDQVHCSIRTGRPEWSPPPPVCEASARPWDRGLRAAVLVSVVSGGVILAMTLSFIICCLQERCRKEGRGRRREPYSTCGTQCWLDRGEGGESDLQPPKIFHLSQRMNPHLAPDSALYLTGGQTAYENRGYQRGQERPLRPPHLHRSGPPAPTAPPAPLYLHLPFSSPAHPLTNSQPYPHPPVSVPVHTHTAAAPLYPGPPGPYQWQ